MHLVAIGALLVLGVLVPVFTQWAMDNVVARGDADLLTLLAVAMTIVLLLQLVFTTFRSWFLTYTSSTFSLQWKSSVLAPTWCGCRSPGSRCAISATWCRNSTPPR